MNEEEKKTIEKFIEKCYKYDESVEIKGISVGEEYRMLNTVCKALNLIEKLQKENEELNYKLHSKKIALEIYNRYIPKSKLKEFFSSRLEKYQEADDGKYEQDYLTRGELELVDRYKECKEIAKIILEEEINSEVPQNCIPKSLVKEKIEELKEKEQELSDEQGYWGGSDLLAKIEVLQDLLERSGEDANI